jgi:hypothetical protein
MAKSINKKSKKRGGSPKSAMGTAKTRAAFFKTKEYKNKLQKFKKAGWRFGDGNDFWNRRSKHGRDAIFSSPEVLQEAIEEYFHDNKQHPWTKKEWKSSNGKLKMVEIPIETPMTWEGLAIFCGVSVNYFRTFKATTLKTHPKRAEFLLVMDWADQAIFKQKLEGSAVGAYNAQLMSYHLGIRKDMPTSGGGSGVIVNVQVDKDKSLINEVMEKLNELDKEDS